MKVSFSFNQYDDEGDSFDDCLLLHIDKTIILRLKDVSELDSLINSLNLIKEEIVESYPDKI
ncbi:MAG: hypothetical protein ACYC5G_04400 [Candidatus Doudnabacteria bacterium]